MSGPSVAPELIDWAFLKAFCSDVFNVAIEDYGTFFRQLAIVAQDVFGSQLAVIWDNNRAVDCLVLLESVPAIKPVPCTDALRRDGSLTDKAITESRIVVNSNIRQLIGAERRTTHGNVLEDGLDYLVSIPAADTHGGVSFVLNLFFRGAGVEAFTKPGLEVQWLQNSLGLALDYLALRVDKQIRRRVDGAVAEAVDLTSLFECIAPVLEQVLQVESAALYSVSAGGRQLHLEGQRGFSEGGNLIWRLEQNGAYELLARECVSESRACFCAQTPDKPAGPDGEKAYWPLTAVPIKTAAGQMVGVLICEKKSISPTRQSFSSMDLRSLKAFARGMAPYVDRFLRLRSSSTLTDVIKRVTLQWSTADELGVTLQRTVETIVDALNAEVGSIFLREDEGERKGQFILRAATEPMKKLIGHATYSPGEGLTGLIAKNKLLHFRSFEEREKYPGRLGKYEREIWGDANHVPAKTYLGVPIEIRGNVLGVWKVENIRATRSHPDSFFTDEDVRLAQVLSTFLAYAIVYRKHQKQVSRDLRLLAQSTIDIATANSEEDAILGIMGALEKCSLPPALLSLYDEKTQMITAYLASGEPWTSMIPQMQSHISSGGLLAEALSRDQPIFVPDSTRDPRCNRESARAAGLRAQFVVPLTLNQERIGTLQVDMKEFSGVDQESALLIDAFASHLSIAISRVRAIRRAMELTDEVMGSGRFAIAEALAGISIHQVKHTLRKTKTALAGALDRKEVRERREVLEIVTGCLKEIDNSFETVENALSLVKAPTAGANVTDVHEGVQMAVNNWIALLNERRCSVRKQFEAAGGKCKIPPYAFREIMSVLIVNAVQAHAHVLQISTKAVEFYETRTGNFLISGLLLTFADDGQGLATTQTEELFSPTYTTKAENLGTGLGLYIARELARRSGGDVWAEPPSGKGATFCLALPLARG